MVGRSLTVIADAVYPAASALILIVMTPPLLPEGKIPTVVPFPGLNDTEEITGAAAYASSNAKPALSKIKDNSVIPRIEILLPMPGFS